jgi:SAM-dependent methyltransferase
MQVHWLREAAGSLQGKSVVEIGSGWEPLIPLLFSLCGAKRVYLTDSNCLLDRTALAGTLAIFRLHREKITQKLGIEPQEFDRKCALDSPSISEFLERFRFTYFAPCDCQRLGLEQSTLDFVISRAVFEHIAPEIIDGILEETWRILKPGGLICHFIDNSDHWEHNDKRIPRINFLRFSDRAFRWTYLNPLNYQNRLRHIEYATTIKKHGFAILREEREIDAKSIAALPALRLDPRFHEFSAEDLATTDSRFLARKAASLGVQDEHMN